MRVVEPREFSRVKHPKRKRTPKLKPIMRLGIVAIAVGYTIIVMGRPLPPAVLSAENPTVTAQEQSVPIGWPSYGQAAIGAVGYGILATQGTQKPLPTASVAKVMTALAVLKQKPLALGEQGPMLTMSQADVDEYARTVAMDGSNVPVVLGEQISQYQALQALLLPSANNMAHALAKWAYGSEESYLQFVNNFAKSLGMRNSFFADASGYSSKTVSTAEDLVKLAVNAMDNPVIAEVAAQEVATIPVAGQIYNVNMLLGSDGIVGVKTGNTEQAGGCFMAAAVREIDGKRVVAVSVIMGAPNLYTALQDSRGLIKSVLDGFSITTAVTAGQVVGKYSLPWGNGSTLKTGSAVKVVFWRAAKPTLQLALPKSPDVPQSAGGKVGSLRVQAGRETIETEIVAESALTKPTWWWRLTHPL